MTDNLFKYISGKDLMDRWGIDLTKMWQISDDFLQAYEVRRKGSYLMPPSINSPVEDGIKINSNVTLYPKKPISDPTLLGFVFLINDIKCFEKDRPEIIDPANPQPQIQPQNGIVIDGTAPEYLLVAAKAWEALYKSGEYRKWKGKPVKNIVAWIKKHYPHIDPTPATKIAQIINHDPKGGTPVI